MKFIEGRRRMYKVTGKHSPTLAGWIPAEDVVKEVEEHGRRSDEPRGRGACWCGESDGEVGMIGLVNRTAPPCKGCQHRHAKCHGQREDYAVYLQAVQTDKEKRYAAYSEGDFYSMNIARRESAKKAVRKRDGR